MRGMTHQHDQLMRTQQQQALMNSQQQQQQHQQQQQQHTALGKALDHFNFERHCLGVSEGRSSSWSRLQSLHMWKLLLQRDTCQSHDSLMSQQPRILRIYLRKYFSGHLRPYKGSVQKHSTSREEHQKDWANKCCSYRDVPATPILAIVDTDADADSLADST